MSTDSTTKILSFARSWAEDQFSFLSGTPAQIQQKYATTKRGAKLRGHKAKAKKAAKR